MGAPEWTTMVKVRDLAGSNYMLRATDEADSPWKHVVLNTYGAWNDAPECITITFDDGEVRRFLNLLDDVEIRFPFP